MMKKKPKKRNRLMPEVEQFKYQLIQGLLYDTPLMIAPGKAEILHNVIQGYSMGKPPEVDAAAFPSNTERKPYQMTTSGIAVISVMGSLTHRAGFLDALSGMTSYSRLASQLRKAEKDQDVKAILLDVDSPGGSVSGLFDLAAEIKRIDSVKTVWALSNESMFSAAYAIGASASRIIAPETAMVGSIGVIMMHLDQSKAHAKAGKKYTPIYAGHHKIDGSSHAPLSKQAQGTYQNIVDQNYDIFVRHVASGRTSMSEQDVIDTQAQIYTAKDAMDVGLIDQIASHDEALNLLEAEIQQPVLSTLATASKSPETIMSEKETGITSVISQADLDSAVANAKAEGHETGLQAGREAEQTRINSILKLDSAKGKIDATLSAAIENGLEAEAADKFLVAVPAKATNGFTAAMDALGNPEIGVDTGEGSELTDDQLAAKVVSLVQS
jgi:signal peptide peptidase SppA